LSSCPKCRLIGRRQSVPVHLQRPRVVRPTYRPGCRRSTLRSTRLKRIDPMATYAVVRTTQSNATRPRGVEVESLSEQLQPIHDALLAMFDRAPAKSRGELHRLEVGLVVTADGMVAFPSEDIRPSLTLTLGSRQRAPATRSASSRSSAAKKPDVVEIPASTIESESTSPR
jgi:hypothetical protein